MESSEQCSLYLYTPSLPLALVAVILFSGLTSVHATRMIQTHTWDNTFFVLGGLAQLAGYTARLFSAQNACNRIAYGIQSVLLLLGPTLLMFSVNLTQIAFTRALNAEHLCWVPISLKRPLYLGLNTVLFILQLIGGIMTTASTSMTTVATGTKIIIASFVIQTVFWGFTFAEHTTMTVRLGRQPSTNESQINNWKYWNQLFGLAISIIAFGRNIMRLTMDGGIDFLISNEWPSYAFDGYQMVVVMGAWAIWYLPEKCLEANRRKDSVYINLERAGSNGLRD